MEDCEHYEDCLNDPMRDKDMELRCQECNDISAELINIPEVTGVAAPESETSKNADSLHQNELKEIASLLGDVDSALSSGDYDQAAEQCRIAKWRLEKRIGVMFT